MSSDKKKRLSSKDRAQAIIQAGGMTRRQIMLVIVGLMFAMFLSSLSQTVVGTAMRTIADDLQGLDQQAWVVTAFLITSTVVTPIYGKLSDIFGRRPLFIFAIILFLIGSIASSFSQSMIMLAAFRALQGLGAGGLMSLPLAIMADVLSPRERAKYQGYFLAIFGVSSVLGPLIGGLFAGIDSFAGIEGWRWVFLFNLPIGILALWMVSKFLHLPKHSGSARIDWWGATTIVLAVVPLLLVAEQGTTWGWTSPAALVCYAVGLVSAVAFVLIQRAMGPDALIPLALFRSPTFSMATVIGVFVGIAMFSGMMMIPFVLQIVHHMDPTQAGFMMIPMVAGMMFASIGSGQVISRTGRYRIFPIAGTATMAIALGILALLQYDSPIWLLMIGQLLFGLGLGQLMQTLTIASQNSVEPRDMGVATSSATFFRQLGGTAGTAAVFSLLYGRLPTTLPAAFDDPSHKSEMAAALGDPNVIADPTNSRILEVLQNPADIGHALNSDSSFLTGADPRLAAPFLDGFAQATAAAFWLALVVSIIAFVLSLFFKTPPLRETSALQQALDDDKGYGRETSHRTGPLPTAPVVVETLQPADDDAGGDGDDGGVGDAGVGDERTDPAK
ncbi:multidrug transporter, MFS superfamily [Agrococcus casei LMG 22410]|uniref:Multidrug transporter, MFS superfamily n=2 Tax=Agrococcus TaxID=46352 RepID=A0A1R4G8E2_9MICO|nr:multidrug transporter, MFS superfamily [Agrococcus casei LMG 22410]